MLPPFDAPPGEYTSGAPSPPVELVSEMYAPPESSKSGGAGKDAPTVQPAHVKFETLARSTTLGDPPSHFTVAIAGLIHVPREVKGTDPAVARRPPKPVKVPLSDCVSAPVGNIIGVLSDTKVKPNPVSVGSTVMF